MGKQKAAVKEEPRPAVRNCHEGHRERRKKQFLEQGIDALQDHEVLELLLFYAIPRRDVNPLAHALLDRYRDLEAVLAAPVEELVKEPGLGENAAILLKLVPQVFRRARASAAFKEKVLDTSDRIGRFFLEQFVAVTEEVMYQLCLDAKGRMICCKKVAEGDVGSIALQIRKIVENAVLSRAVMVAVAHNHPSGIAFPSVEDEEATMRIKDALETVGVRLVEHIIVADDDYVSLCQMGML